MDSVPVLMYHAVGAARDARFRRWVVAPSLLEDQLRAVSEAGYALIGVSEWAAAHDREWCAVLTFDDGYGDFADLAFPILQALGARATVYPATAFVGGTASWLPEEGERGRPMLGWDDLALLSRSGIEIGSHGHRHVQLDAVPVAQAREDVLRSKRNLTARGLTPRSFCYPFGYSNSAVRRVVREAGFSTACIVGDGLFRSDGDPLRIRRLLVDGRSSPEGLVARFRRRPVSARRRVVETGRPVWRMTRRARRLLGKPRGGVPA